MPKRSKSPLTIATPPPATAPPSPSSAVSLPATLPDPPASLGSEGCRLWRSIMQQYVLDDDAGALAVLEMACASVDRAAQCRRAIEEGGVVDRWAARTQGQSCGQV